MISVSLLISSIIISYKTIQSTLLFRFYRISFLSSLIFIALSLILTFFGRFFHIKPKLQTDNSFDGNTLQIQRDGQKAPKFQIVDQNCSSIQIKSFKGMPFFGSEWVQKALNQHKGLERAILCDVYEAMLLPEEEVTTDLSQSSIQLISIQI